MANMYCALYRKYRPDILDDVVGQNIIIQTLKNAINNNHISHAYLFTGPRGTGKTSIAKILAKTVNCVDLVNTQPCDKCVSCTQIKLKQNTDIIEIDAASNNGVDEIREIRNKVNLVPSVSRYKVYIIDEVHMLTTGAFNALLKTLEEPPGHIIFILATTEPHKIPNTILSRCQRFDFKRIGITDIIKRLNYICTSEKINITQDALQQIAISSDGGMRDAISTLDQIVSYAGDTITIDDVHAVNGTLSETEISEFIDLLLDDEIDSLMEKINDYYDDGKNIVKIIEEMVLFLKNIVLSIQAPNFFKNNQYDYSVYEKYVNFDVNKIIGYINLFNQEINEIKKSSWPKLLFELLIIKLTSNKDKQKKSEVEIVEKPQHVVNTPKKLNINAEKIQRKEETKSKNLEKDRKKIIELQQIRIDNTLSRFNKSLTIQIKKDLEGLSSLLMDPDVSQIVSVILDGELKAASEEYTIFVFETENDCNMFNDNIKEVEKVLKLILQEEYKTIGVKSEEWLKIKDEFNHKSREFKYNEEKIEEIENNNVGSSPDNEIDDLFGDVVEYEI